MESEKVILIIVKNKAKLVSFLFCLTK